MGHNYNQRYHGMNYNIGNQVGVIKMKCENDNKSWLKSVFQNITDLESQVNNTYHYCQD